MRQSRGQSAPPEDFMTARRAPVTAILGITVLAMAALACDQLLSPFKPSSTSSSTTGSTTVAFKITTVTAIVDNFSSNSTCPVRFTFTGTMSSNDAGAVTFKWERSDGSATPTETMAFPSATSLTASNTWEIGSSISGWQRLHVLTPNEMFSNAVNVQMTCK
jgi:hypothetical protein